MEHLGANCYNGIKAIKNCPNVYTDTSGCMFRRDDIDYTVSLIGADRVLFATYMPGGPFLVNFGRIEEADLSQEERDAIYFGNAKRLLGI